MEELIFIGIIIAFTIIDSIARTVKAKREAKRGAGQGSEARQPNRRSPASARDSRQEREASARTHRPPSHERVPTYDADPTYDEEPTYDDEQSYDAEWSSGGVDTYDAEVTRDRQATSDGAEGRSSSAGMIPQDLWEEIAGLARGQVEPAPTERPLPRRAPTRPAPVTSRAPTRPAPVKSRSSTLPAAPELHAIHLTHADYGTDPSERVTLASAAGGRRGRANPEVRAVRAQLGGGVGALRRAVILQEVLGPPASQREDRIEELLER